MQQNYTETDCFTSEILSYNDTILHAKLQLLIQFSN